MANFYLSCYGKIYLYYHNNLESIYWKSEDKMEQLVSISKIFSEKIFRIPDYQRGYAWTTKEVEDFWGDLCRLENNKNHYVGVLTLEPTKFDEYSKWYDDIWIIEAKRYVPFYIVDGQQRLTTSVILIYTILEIMQEKEIKKLNYTTQDEISRKYIYECQDENKNRTYMYGYEVDNPSYEYLITQIYNEKLIAVNTNDETIYTNNLQKAKDFFYNKLREIDKEELENVYTKITQHFLFNVYIISEDIDVFVTFETMNNRGKPLSNLELLKNRLIYVSTLFKVDENEKKRLRRDVNNCWKNVYHILGKNKERKLLDDEFLVTHFMLYFAKNIDDIKEEHRRGCYEFGEWQSNYLLNVYFVVQKITDDEIKMSDCFDYIQSMNECIEFWGNIKNPSSSFYSCEIKECIDKINFFSRNRYRYGYGYGYRGRYSTDYSYLNVFMLACFRGCDGDNEILLNFLKTFEKYLFAIEFYDREAIDESGIKNIRFSEIVVKLNRRELAITEVIEKIKRIYEQLTSNIELSKSVIRLYGKNGFYNRASWLKYFLYEYELSLMKKSKTNIKKINSQELYERGYNSIEHIYPENSHCKYWIEKFTNFDTKQKKALKNTLGNFVLISNEKNGKLGNKSFPEKKSNKENPVGYKYGTYAEIEISEVEDWTAEIILTRGLKLISFLYERWGIKIGNAKKEDKKKFLGLDFM